jgi:hypothetical protein
MANTNRGGANPELQGSRLRDHHGEEGIPLRGRRRLLEPPLPPDERLGLRPRACANTRIDSSVDSTSARTTDHSRTAGVSTSTSRPHSHGVRSPCTAAPVTRYWQTARRLVTVMHAS